MKNEDIKKMRKKQQTYICIDKYMYVYLFSDILNWKEENFRQT